MIRIQLYLVYLFSFTRSRIAARVDAPKERRLDRPCTLCYDGSSPLYPSKMIQVPFSDLSLPCFQADIGLKSMILTDDTSQGLCQVLQQYSGPCGCPVPTMSGPTCRGMCASNRPMTYPNRTIPINMLGSGFYFVCSQWNQVLQSLPNSSLVCQTMPSQWGAYCGCPDANYSTACTPCYKNMDIPNYDLRISQLNDTTCGKYVVDQTNTLLNNGTWNQQQCLSFQTATASVCNCSLYPPSISVLKSSSGQVYPIFMSVVLFCACFLVYLV
jgi:hypothetical protein